MKNLTALLIILTFSVILKGQYQLKEVNLIPSILVTEDFKFPLGYPDLQGYHDAKAFGVNNHLGCDLNKDGNGNNDLGDTIKAIGYGFVTISSEARIVLMHRTKIEKHPYILSVYFHCDKLLVDYGELVIPGQPIATVGKKFTTLAHLHFEIVTDLSIEAGGFYGEDNTGFLDPVKFINKY